MPLKILIVEDEKPNATRLNRFISQLRPDAQVLGMLESVADTIQWFGENECPDLVMMDVRLVDGLSFEIFEKIEIHCPIIFTTAYDEYAVRAFKYNSIDYLLKPVELDELENALKKADSQRPLVGMRSLEVLLGQYLGKQLRNRFLLPYRDGYKTVLVKDIEYIYSESKITRSRLVDGTEEILPQTLEELESQLDPKLFFRANRGFIISEGAIGRVFNHFNGKLKIELRNYPELEVLVSRDKAQVFKSWMDF
jgi:DNA-binding LytR/AlgR family response regulator